MKRLLNKYAEFKQWVLSPRGKKVVAIAVVALIVLWVIFRFTVIGIQHRMQVFNPARYAAENGVPVSVIEMKQTAGVIREPLTVKNNRAYVSGTRMRRLAPNQRVGEGKIVSVASNIDLDSGMHVVITAGVADGLHFAEFNANGYFVPVDAVYNNSVFVARDGNAVAVPVTVARSDDETAYITSGLKDGDIVILSRVSAGDKIQIKK